MAVFHFVYDLEAVGLLPFGTAREPFWRGLAVLVAGSFIFLAGMSLVLAHRNSFRRRPFLKRLAMIAGAAALVSAATYAALPFGWVRFGILHLIALASVIGLVFLRRPWWVSATGATAVWFVAVQQPLAGIRADWLLWLAPTLNRPMMADYEPLLPWLAPFLLGMAVMSWMVSRGLDHRLASRPSRATDWLGWPGRHSLAIYLIHQPVLLGLVWTYARLT